MENKIQHVVEEWRTTLPVTLPAYFFPPLHPLYCISTLIISYIHPLPALQTNVNFPTQRLGLMPMTKTP